MGLIPRWDSSGVQQSVWHWGLLCGCGWKLSGDDGLYIGPFRSMGEVRWIRFECKTPFEPGPSFVVGEMNGRGIRPEGGERDNKSSFSLHTCLFKANSAANSNLGSNLSQSEAAE